MATEGGFSIGISPEQKLALPLDDLIKKHKTVNKKTKKAKEATGKAAVTVNLKKSKTAKKTMKRKQENVKKTVVVPVSKAVRARVNNAVSSSKRQAVMNKRRPGLVVAQQQNTKRTQPVRRQNTSALRVAHKIVNNKNKKNVVGGLDVSNIQRHFRSHPKKFDLPKGANLRITINVNTVKPVVGTNK